MSIVKPIRYTQHAETVIRERQLDATWIERTVRDPEWQQADTSDLAACRFFRKVPERDGRILRVVAVETVKEIRIISSFLDRDAKKPK